MFSRLIRCVFVSSLVSFAGLAIAAGQGELGSLLKSTLESIQAGKPNLSQMEPLTAEAVKQQMGTVGPIVKNMGKIQSATYLGMQTMQGGAGEAYRVTFEHGSMLWVISESSAGKILILWTQGPETTSPASSR